MCCLSVMMARTLASELFFKARFSGSHIAPATHIPPSSLELSMPSTSLTALDKKLVSDEFLDDPYPLLRQLRQEEPVFWSESIGGWILTRYDDIVPTFQDVAHFTNYGRFAKTVEYLPPDARKKLAPFENHYRQKNLLQSDPPDHTRLRALVVKVFNANSIEAMRPMIRKVVNEVIDAVRAARPDGCDPRPRLPPALQHSGQHHGRSQHRSGSSEVLGRRAPGLPGCQSSTRGRFLNARRPRCLPCVRILPTS